MFRGVCTALVTPFLDKKSGQKIDFQALEKLINFQIENGINSLCVGGTTGEIATLNDEEYAQLIQETVKITAGKVFILAGIGGNDTQKVIKNAQTAENLGANGVLAVAPYYNKPTQAGLLAHFSTLASETSLPIMLYNVPSRTVTDISDDTTVELSKIKNIVALKDASGAIERVAILRSKLAKNGSNPDDFQVFSGDDASTLGYIAMGAVGLISVASNIFPKECAEMVNLTLNGRFQDARIIQDKFGILFDSMFCETNPAPVKYCLSKLEFIQNEIRLPIVKTSPEAEKRLDRILSDLQCMIK